MLYKHIVDVKTKLYIVMYHGRLHNIEEMLQKFSISLDNYQSYQGDLDYY